MVGVVDPLPAFVSLFWFSARFADGGDVWFSGDVECAGGDGVGSCPTASLGLVCVSSANSSASMVAASHDPIEAASYVRMICGFGDGCAASAGDSWTGVPPAGVSTPNLPGRWWGELAPEPGGVGRKEPRAGVDMMME